MNVRKKRILVVLLGILITVIFPIIGWFAGGLVGEYNGVSGCASLGWAGVGLVLGLFGYFLGGLVNGLLQPKTENTKYHSILYSIIILIVSAVIMIPLGGYDISICIFTDIMLLILAVISWFGCHVGFKKQATRIKKTNEAQP